MKAKIVVTLDESIPDPTKRFQVHTTPMPQMFAKGMLDHASVQLSLGNVDGVLPADDEKRIMVATPEDAEGIAALATAMSAKN